MTGPDPLGAEAVAVLVEQPGPGPGPAPRRSLARRVAGRGRRTLRGLAARGRAKVVDLAEQVAEPLYARASSEVEPRLQRIVTEALAADPSLTHVREISARGGLDDARARERDEAVRAARVNLELLKGELRHVQSTLDELGMAFAPATGLAGAGARFAELREAVHTLERRLRNEGTARPAAPALPAADDGGTSGSSGPAGASGPAILGPRPEVLSSTLFDYVGFERRFRGDPEEILTTLVDRYGELLADHQPVVDIGCGRGELLGRLAERGIEVIGIEPDPGMADEARARGITVHEELAGDWLRSVPDGSLGSIITTHVLEHLQLDDMIELLELSVTKLRPGAVFISETPNPASLIVLGNSYLLDPTHVRPLHPSLLSFLCENAGFRDVRLRFFSPATGYHLPTVDLAAMSDAPAWAVGLATSLNTGFERLNDVLFGPQDYAVVATTAPARDGQGPSVPAAAAVTPAAGPPGADAPRG